MKETIIELLEVSAAYYEDVVLKTFIDWCMEYNTSQYALQLALSNKAIQRYFTEHYSVLERQFIVQVESYKHLPASDKNGFYAEVTNAIFKSYPGALSPKLKKKELTLRNYN